MILWAENALVEHRKPEIEGYPVAGGAGSSGLNGIITGITFFSRANRIFSESPFP